MKNLILILFAIISIGANAQSSSYERDSVAQTPAFQVKVKMAAHKAAGDILADTLAADRIRQYCQIILSEPQGGQWLPALSYQCMANVAINYNSSDGDIQYTVNSVLYKTAYAYWKEEEPTTHMKAVSRRLKAERLKKEEDERNAPVDGKVSNVSTLLGTGYVHYGTPNKLISGKN